MFIRSSSLLVVLVLIAGCSPENTLRSRHSAEAVNEINVGVSPFSPPTHSTDTADTGGAVDLKQGDPLTLEATFGTKDDCGAYLVRELDWRVYDFSSGAVWIYNAYNTMPASNLVETTTPQVFADYASESAGFGLDSDGNIVDGGTEWIWRTPESGWAVGAEIASQRVEESAAMKYQFTWNGSASAPVGETLVFTLQFGWNDLATGAIMAPNDADRELTVIITE